ncbi:MAG: hypothetical protein GY778_24510 [bacterium]|nr:hypothetical protein [bacterium]
MTVACSGCASPYLMTVDDVVCPVDEKVRLIGKLEYRGVAVFNKGLDDGQIRFYLDGQPVGEDDTNDEGYARIKRRFASPGRRRLEIRYRDGRGRTQSAEATVFVWDPSQPILVVDVDNTLAHTKKRYLFSRGPDRSAPFATAVEVLTELADHFRVVYLTARPRELAVKTRQWLAAHDFPAGPVLTWDVDRYEWSATSFKKDRLDDLTDRFDHVTIGIGNAPGDHTAYRKRRLLTILIDADAPAATIERGVRLPDWRVVQKLFKANPALYDPELSYKTRLIIPPADRPAQE